MDESAAFATKAELEQVKKEQKRMAIRLEGIDSALTGLTTEVAHLSERVERVESKVDALGARFERLEQLVADGIAEARTSQASLMSAIMTLGKK